MTGKLSIKQKLFIGFGWSILAFYGFLFAATVYAADYYASPKAPTTAEYSAPTIVVNPTEIDPELLPITQALNMKTDGLKIVYVDSFAQPHQNGLFDGVRTISIKRGGGQGSPVTNVLAHEYLHYIWNNEPNGTKDVISSQLMSLYNDDGDMQARMAYYLDEQHNMLPGSPEFVNELHSIYCTESSDAWLSSAIKEHCNKFISRSALSFQR